MADEGEIRSYRDLIVWQRAMEAADLVLEMVESGPLANKYRLAGQIEAASASIPANIAEGHELATLPQYLKHLYYARGSLAESRTFLEMFQKRRYFKDEDARRLWGLYVEVSKMLNTLIARLEGGLGGGTNPIPET
jgi:four helix bundle protein